MLIMIFEITITKYKGPKFYYFTELYVCALLQKKVATQYNVQSKLFFIASQKQHIKLHTQQGRTKKTSNGSLKYISLSYLCQAYSKWKFYFELEAAIKF